MYSLQIVRIIFVFSRVYVEITNICNMNCSFCHGHSRDFRTMSASEFEYILRQLKDHTQYIYYHLMGEPLTHPDFPLFLQMAKDNGYKSVITTNGTLLKKLGNDIIDIGVHKVNISVHSFEKGTKETFTRYMSEICTFSDIAADKGIIVVLRLWNGGSKNLNDDVIEFCKEHLSGDWTKNTKGITIRKNLYIEYDNRFGWPDMATSIQGDNFFCYGLRDHFGILCDGTVVPCCLDSDGIINLGNIFKESIDDILSSPRAKAISEAFSHRKASEELCKRCQYAQRFIK